MSEEKILKELDAEASKLYAPIVAEAVPEVEVPVETELRQAVKEIYGKEPQLAQVLGIVAAQGGTATYALIDYSFTSNIRYLWAYAGGAWRNRAINNSQVAGIAQVVMNASRLDVWWTNNKINLARCWKKF